MPKKKAGGAKRRERQSARQREIRNRKDYIDLGKEPCNAEMECAGCGQKQKNRAFCYFCSSLQRLPQCAGCGRTKCQGGDCVVPHVGKSATGMLLVGAVCDFCEAWVCHSKKCLQSHACRCPIADSSCVECQRGVWEHGGRMFRCATCMNWLCEDDQFEHQASCQMLDSETGHCISCNRLGVWSCLRCKIAFCDNHVKNKMNANAGRKDPHKCKKCGYELQESKLLSMSTRHHAFGRQTRDEANSGYYGADRFTGGPSDGLSQLDLGSDDDSYSSDEEGSSDDEGSNIEA